MTQRWAWRFGVGLQSAAGQSGWFGAQIAMTYLALSLGADPVFIGVQASCFAAAGLVFAIPAGRLADRIGGAFVASLGLLLLMSGIALVIVFPTLAVLLVAGFVGGAGYVITVMGQQSLVARVAPPGKRDAAFGTLSATMALGQLVGPPLVTTVGTLLVAPDAEINATAGLIVCAAAASLALLPTFVLRSIEAAAESSGPPAERVRLAAAARIPGMGQALAVSGTVQAGVDLLTSFLPLWAVERGISPTVVGGLLALRAFVTILSRFGLSLLITRFGRRLLLTVAIAISAIAIAALPFVNAWGGVAVMFLLGFGFGLPQPLTMGWVTSLAPAPARNVALAMRLLGHRLAQVTLPLVVSTVAGPLGVSAVLITTAGILAVSAGLAATSSSLKREGPGDDLSGEATINE